MRSVRPLLALALVVAASLPAWAGDEPVGDGKLARVRLGWDGFVPRDTVAPVTVFLANGENRERTIRISASPLGGEGAERVVTLAPGARKRVTFALHVQGQVTVALSEGMRLLARSTLTASLLPAHAVLCVDGEPDSLQTPEVASGCVVVFSRIEEVPAEVACLARFNGIVLRRVDPSSLDPGARAALEDYVRAGGTLVVNAPAEHPAMREPFESLPAATERREEPFALRTRGLGRVVDVPTDLGALKAGAEERAALGTLLLATRRAPFPRIHRGEHSHGSATRAGVLLGCFLLAYFLIAGPVFAIALRGRKPLVVLRALAIMLAAFVALGALTAAFVRQGTGNVVVHAVTVIPASGEQVVLADLALESAGRRTQDVVVEGEDVSLTSFGRTGRRLAYLGWNEDPQWFTDVATTERALGKHSVHSKDHPVPPFGETGLTVIASAKDAAPLDVSFDAARGTVTIRNTLDHDLGRLVVTERVARHGAWSFARAKGLARGKTATLKLENNGSAWSCVPLGGAELEGWSEVAPPDASGARASFVLLAEEPAPLEVSAPGATVEMHSWRVQGIPAPASTVPGWLGVSVKKTERGLRITAIDGRSPAASIWVLQGGRVVTSIDDMPVRSVADLQRVLRQAGPGARVRIATEDGNSAVVDLGDPPPDATDDEGE
jgi:hypothetical protein